ncbi:hypothetical protein LNKW23_34160 [Paralimibaculum aggregatum]|uniref:Serine protease n=1 Tax=Paralimibaculum aggregatum TaxID=3036245 RepID=A0ABQ6LQG3_9RHOB|nr:CARDB domain-containing protein [Limibaculum sp. NKW23]GMG84202.1 hypothetical protein LNKW23_34160 [Limibaculum sp. NKW23]
MAGAAQAEAGPGLTQDESVFGSDDRVRVGDTTAFPWRSIGKVTITAEAGIFVGTGFLVGAYHMLTAGHVVHSGEFGSDPWAQSITVAFGKDGALEPFARAEAAAMRAPAGWTGAADTGADWALVTLDRSIGAVLGYMDLAAPPEPAGANVTLAGYPGDLSGGAAQYAAAGTLSGASDDRLFYGGTLDTAGGMSGAPVWQYYEASGRREVIGIHTTGAADPQAPGASNGATRLTAATIGLIEEWIGQDAILNPPTDLPDLTDAVTAFGSGTAAISRAELGAGESATLTVDLANIGTAAAAGTITVYASTNATITEYDTPLGSAAIPALAPFAQAEITVPLEIPAAMPAGSYRLGWALEAAGGQAEFGTTNNTGLIAQSITVSARPDLLAEALSLSATAWQAGQAIGVSWTVRNAGGAAAPAVGSALHLSPDPVVDAADTLLLADPQGTLLAAGGAATEGAPFVFTVPAELPSGTYHVAALADSDGQVAEASEGNNASAAIVIEIGAPGISETGTAGADLMLGGALDDTLRGAGGDDTLRGGGGADRLEGGADADLLYGEAQQDSLRGDAGADTLLGQAGNDLLEGDLGDRISGQGDLLNGGPGNDTLHGEGGPDTLYGEDGDDSMEGGPGIDLMIGNAGNDTLRGGDKRDTVDGAEGDDSLFGDDGNDAVYGGPGDDTIWAGTGPDFVDGEDGDDLAMAGEDADILLGGAGRDTLLGEAGNDTLRGGDDGDLLQGGAGADRVYGEAGDDSLEGGADNDFLNGNEGDDSLDGGPGDDTLRGGDGADLLAGGDGEDAVAGRAGDDTLLGGAGADALDGEQGDDVLDGGTGNDALRGKAGRDSLDGGPGDDSLFGGNEADTLAGGTGADRIAGEAGIDVFHFTAGDGDDLIFDFQPGLETLLLAGGMQSFGALDLGTSADGWLTLGYSADPGDLITLQGVLPGELTDDGTVVFA